MISTKKCKININNNIFTEFKRCDIKKDYYLPEDIKIIDDINDKDNIIGICNILIQNKPRIFRCALVSIDVNNCLITLKKILSIPNMNGDEKNWLLLNNKYMIYSLFPKLVIYTMDKNYELSHFKDRDTISQLKDTNISKNLSPYYNNFYLTSCQNCIKLNENFCLIICKKKTKKCGYEYYYCIFDIKNWNIYYLDKKLDEGFKKYLNSVITLDNKFYLCWGISDLKYKIERYKIKNEFILLGSVQQFW